MKEFPINSFHGGEFFQLSNVRKKIFSCLYLQKLSSLDVKIKDYTFPVIVLKMLSS